jgi:hypothetical protein
MFASTLKQIVQKPQFARTFATQNKNATAKVFVDKNTRYVDPTARHGSRTVVSQADRIHTH